MSRVIPDIQITGDENQVDHDRVPALEIDRPPTTGGSR